MKKSNLVVCGCSFTHGHTLTNDDTWGAFVAKKKNLKFHNLAKGGMGNEWIAQTTIGFLEKNKELKQDSVVMIAWSETGRLMGTFQPSDELVEPVTIRPDDFVDDGLKKHWPTDTKSYHGYALKYGKILRPFFNNYIYSFLKTYQAIFNLKNYLEINNIPYVFFDALAKNKITSLTWSDEFKDSCYLIYDMVIEDSYGKPFTIRDPIHIDWLDYLNQDFENTIFDKRYIDFNGKSMLLEMRTTNYDYFTEGNGGHPNANACEYFSDLIIEKSSDIL